MDLLAPSPVTRAVATAAAWQGAVEGPLLPEAAVVLVVLVADQEDVVAAAAVAVEEEEVVVAAEVRISHPLCL
jgi:hypothetical protein